VSTKTALVCYSLAKCDPLEKNMSTGMKTKLDAQEAQAISVIEQTMEDDLGVYNLDRLD
jgi:hypothetical protein